MATLKLHTYYVQNLLNKGPMSDDSRFSNRLIAHTLKQARSRLLKIKLDKYDFIADSNYQNICVSLSPETYHDCSCITDNNDCTILRSSEQLPKELVAKWGSTMDVYYLDGRNMPEISPTTNSYASYSITNKNKDRKGWFMDGGYLYVLNSHKLKLIVAKAIWEDPEAARDFTDCTQVDNCDQYSSEEFPIDSELVYPMYQLTLELLGYTDKIAEDNRNDSRAVENIQAIDPNEQRRT